MPRPRSPCISADDKALVLPLIVIRPEPGNAGTVAAARGMGLAACGVALFEVGARAWEPLPVDEADVLLVGSANVFRHGGAALAGYRHLPVHAVGTTTARAGAAGGFVVAAIGSGGLQAVLDRIPAGSRVLRLAGDERIRLEPPAGVSLTERVVYASEPRPLPAELALQLHAPAVVALHSAEAARHFAAECDRLALPRSGLALAAIGPRVSAAAGPGWRAIAVADEPAEVPLLAKARELCHTLAGD